MDSLSTWLQGLGLAQYVPVFAEHEVDFEALRLLTETDLQDLGLALGSRKKLLRAIAELDVGSTPAAFGRMSYVQRSTETTAGAQAERRQLTVMFSDLVDSTALSERLDPEELRDLIRAYQQASAEVIGRYDGHVAQYLGDGLLVYFGHPRAHEDDAHRAVLAGLGIIAAMRTLNSKLAQRAQARLSVRIGIHTGMVVVGDVGAGERREQLALGDAPNLAARLQDLAEPDTVVISERTRQLTGGSFEYADFGQHALKGIARPIRTWRALGSGTAASRFDATTRGRLTPLVGREQEIGLLLDRWQLAKEGAGQVVLMSGEPGIGKSRVLDALRERLEPEFPVTLRFQCSPYYLNSALYPFIDSLQRTLEFSKDAPAGAKLDRLEAMMVSEYGRPIQDLKLVARILSLAAEDRHGPLHLSPKRQKDDTIRALVDLVEAIARRRPCLLLFEDAHWADPTTLEALDALIERAASFPLCAVVSYRPELERNWGGHPHLSTLPLSRLTRAQSTAFVSKVTPSKPLHASIVEHIVAKTDGVPLFIEELTKAVLESSSLRDAGDHYVYCAPASSMAIPATLRDSLTARLDHLAIAKVIAQIGAVIGREFSYDLLSAVAPVSKADLDDALERLTESGLTFVRGAVEGAVYTFKHALVQDAAYDSLLKSMRQELHAKIARVLKDRFNEAVEAHPELLAHHYTQAGMVKQGVAYWKQAGCRAAERSANVEAVNHFNQAIELLGSVSDGAEPEQQELELRIKLGPALVASKGYAAPDVEQNYVRARALCERGGNTSQLFSILRAESQLLLLRARYSVARERMTQLIELAVQERGSANEAYARLGLGCVALFCGRLEEAKAQLEAGSALFDPQRHREHVASYGVDAGVACLAYHARALWFLGYPDQALKQAYEALALAQPPSVPLTLAQAMSVLAHVHYVRREPLLTRDWVEKTISYCSEQGIPYWIAFGSILQGWLLAEQGKASAGVAQILRSVTAYQETGARAGWSLFLVLLAEAHRNNGQLREGLDVLNQAVSYAEETEEMYYAAEVHRVRGELLLMQGGRAAAGEAHACFRKSLEIARSQKAKSWELRAAISTARLLRDQGARSEAHELLAGVYSWFTEGLETADLEQARRLLEAL